MPHDLSMTNWSDLTPWIFVIIGLLTLTKALARIASWSEDPVVRGRARQLEVSGDIAVGLGSLALFLTWIGQYDDATKWVGMVAVCALFLLFVALALVRHMDPSHESFVAKRFATRREEQPRGRAQVVLGDELDVTSERPVSISTVDGMTEIVAPVDLGALGAVSIRISRDVLVAGLGEPA